MRVALVHDYLIRFGGAEQVLLALHRLFPEAPIYTLLYDVEKLGDFFNGAEIKPSFLQKMPSFLRRRYKYFLPFLPLAPETFDLRDFDVIISSSSAFAKGVVTRSDAKHFCYCHNPMRFIWDYYFDYTLQQKMGSVKKNLWFLISHYFRLWDKASASRVDYFIANSRQTAQRIYKYYRKEAEIIYPPAEIMAVNIGDDGAVADIADEFNHIKDYFLIVSQLRPYKRIDLAIEAFNDLNLPLVIIGEGPERKKLEKIAKGNIKFLGFQPINVVRRFYQNCLAFIFSGEDDFGIAPVEAMSFGKPVLAYRGGGALETVKEGITGEFFDELSSASLKDGVCRLLLQRPNYQSADISQHAGQFGEDRFRKEILEFIESKMKDKSRCF